MKIKYFNKMQVADFRNMACLTFSQCFIPETMTTYPFAIQGVNYIWLTAVSTFAPTGRVNPRNMDKCATFMVFGD